MKQCRFIFTLFLLFISSLIFSQDEKLIVGVKDSPPFVIIDKFGINGVSVELWDIIAKDLGLEYEFKEYNLTDLLISIEDGTVDLSINPLTVTAGRLEKFDFTQPFYVTNIAIATKYENTSTLIGYAKKILSLNFIKAVLLLFMVIFIFGIIVWLIERKRNSKQFHKSAKGIGDGIWWSAVTMTSVGYGDKAPRTPLGRIISVLWMLTAVIIISSFTAGIASSLTVKKLESNIKTIDDLKRIKVGTIASSSSASFLKAYGLVFTEYDKISEGLDAVKNDDIKAFVFDEAILRYVIQDKGYNDEIIIIPSTYSKEYFSFASANQALIDKINPILVREIDKKSFSNVLNKYHLDDW